MLTLERVMVENNIPDGVCQWCGKTNLRPSNDGIFCTKCQVRFDETYLDLRNLKENLKANDLFYSQFTRGHEFTEYFLFEALVRLSSPVTGKFFDTLTNLHEYLGIGRKAMHNALEHLEDKGLITLFDVNKRKVAEKGVAQILVHDVDPSDSFGIHLPIIQHNDIVGIKLL